MRRLGYWRPALLAVAMTSGILPARAGNSFPIKHVIIIMQENRSFDSYFGTFPGANGIPAGTCVPYNPKKLSLGCAVPFHDLHDVSGGGPHSAVDAQADIDDGIKTAKMDGFVYQESIKSCSSNATKLCSSAIGQPAASAVPPHLVMGYHTADDLANYWSYAQNFVLQDALFEGVRGWSAVSHDDIVSEWAALCSNSKLASTCVSNTSLAGENSKTNYPWVTLFQLLDMNNVSWKYYLAQGLEPDCDDDLDDCAPEPQTAGVPSIWNPAPYFAYIKAQGAAYLAQHNPPVDQFLVDIRQGTLPQVAWVVPSQQYSEHPRTGFTAGMDYVTSLVNAVAQSSYWNSTAIFVAWDDWGGFYDHVVPPNVDTNSTAYPIQGFGLRVPGLMISAYAKQGYIDHGVLSFDSYATFIENIFFGGTRLVPSAMGNPDNRPTIRDAMTSVHYLDGSTAPIGDLINEFNFHAPPRPPLVLSAHIPSSIRVSCLSGVIGNVEQCPKNAVVTISWDQITGADVTAAYTFHLQRDGVELPGCVTSQASCSDTPGQGQHLYRAYSVAPSGVTSPISAAAEADVKG